MSHSTTRSWWAAGLLVVLGSVCTHASAQSDPGCPKGFEPIPSGAACAAVDLAGPDGTFSAAVREIPPGRNCPEGFERPPGVNFCIAANLTVNGIGRLPILEPQTSRFCPEGFHRPTGSSICIASNLVLKTQRDEGVLVGPTGECPVGFYRPVGSKFCVPGTMQAPMKVLEAPVGPHCPPGFHRPPGVAVCIAKNIVYGDITPINVQIPDGACPKNWHRPAGVRFCVPSHEQANTSSGSGVVLGFTQNLCPAGTNEVWFDMPIYDDAGLFVVDYVPTRFCVPDDLEPAG